MPEVGAPRAEAVETEPGFSYSSHREVETRARLKSADERDALVRKAQMAAKEPGVSMSLHDWYFKVPNFNGSARIRQVHIDGEPEPYYEWTVKEFMPKTGLKVSKAPIEHTGTATSYDDAERHLRYFLKTVLHVEPEFEEKVTESDHRRTMFSLDDGVVLSVDSYTMYDGVEHDPPYESAEFEAPRSKDVKQEEVAEAEQSLITTAAKLGIEESELSSSSGIKEASVKEGA